MSKLLLASTAIETLTIKPCFFDGGQGDGDGGGAGAGAGSSSSGEGGGSTALGGANIGGGEGGDQGGDQGDKSGDGGDAGSGENENKGGQEGAGDKSGDDDGNKDSDDKKSDNGDDSNKGKDGTDGDDAPLTLTAPEGLEAYQGDVDQFASEMDQWTRDNPDATRQDMLSAIVDRQAKLVEEQRAEQARETARWGKQWEEEARADPEFGGDNYDPNVALAVKGAEMVLDQNTLRILDETKLGNNVGLLKAFAAVGATAKEAPVLKGAGAAENLSLADALYGGNKSSG